MIRFVEHLTGARQHELKQVLYCFTAVFFLLLSYYLIKPLRNSQFLSDFDPNYLPVIMLVVPFISFIVTKIFNYFCNKLEKFKVIVWTYLLLIGIKIAFTWILQLGGKAATVLFYFFGSVYFLLALPLLWGCINNFFHPEQSERVFSFVQLGATLGNIIGSIISGLLARSVIFSPYATLFSAGSMGIALFFLILAASQAETRSSASAAPVETADLQFVKNSFWSDVLGLIRLRYVRSIAIMVACLACFTTSLDFLSQTVIDQQLSRQEYARSFPELSSQLGEQGYQFFYSLKSLPREKVVVALSEFQQKYKVERCQERYQEYKKSLEMHTRAVFSDVAFYQGLAGFFLLTIVARQIFTHFGLRVASSILPAFALIALIAFAFPIQILMVEILLVLSGSLNYALNNASKEILYSATSEETKFRHKPLIEGPCMRLGDQAASIIKLSTAALAVFMSWNSTTGNRIFLSFTFILALIWWKAIAYAGRIYDEKRNLERYGVRGKNILKGSPEITTA